jgi:hypothetical protein
MPCDHSGPTCAMHHIPEPLNPHTPVKPQVLALIPCLTWRFFFDRLLKKKMHLVGMDTLLILLSLGP